jgi:hypothetical protein
MNPAAVFVGLDVLRDDLVDEMGWTVCRTIYRTAAGIGFFRL